MTPFIRHWQDEQIVRVYQDSEIGFGKWNNVLDYASPPITVIYRIENCWQRDLRHGLFPFCESVDGHFDQGQRLGPFFSTILPILHGREWGPNLP